MNTNRTTSQKDDVRKLRGRIFLGQTYTFISLISSNDSNDLNDVARLEFLLIAQSMCFLLVFSQCSVSIVSIVVVVVVVDVSLPVVSPVVAPTFDLVV